MFSGTLCDAVCAHIIEGKSLRQITKLRSMPKLTTIMKWLRTEPTFAKQYAHAKHEQAEGYADEIVSIADSATPQTVNVARLRVDARKWVAAKLLPHKYGEHVIAPETRRLPADELPNRIEGELAD